MTCQEFSTSKVLTSDEKKPTQGGQPLLTNRELVAGVRIELTLFQLMRLMTYPEV